MGNFRSGHLLLAAVTVVGAAATGATAATATTGATAAPVVTADSEPPSTSFGGTCPAYGDLHICSAQIPSFDGAPLDVDLTEPTNDGPGKKHPLIVLIHGFGNNKHEWQSTTDAGDGADKYHWNSHWFAKHGYYVLTATARGFRDDGTDRDDEPTTPSYSSFDGRNGTLHLKSREFEIRDTQWLAALAAQARPDIDRSQVAVSGGSYGGGESWVQASQPEWTFARDCTTPGSDIDPRLAAACAANYAGPPLPALSLQVAVPKYPWTDLAYSLAPHGRPGRGDSDYESAQADETNTTGLGQNPFGVLKSSYVAGFFALGTPNFENGTTTPTYEEGPINIPAWNARALAGEPYDVGPGADPVTAQLARGLTEFRSAYYQDKEWDRQVGRREVAVYSIQGWTDDLFGAVESFRMFKALKRRDPRWPVAVGLGDVGHARAQNQKETWQRLNAQAFSFLQSQIGGSHRLQTSVSSEPTTCGEGATPSARVTGSTPEDLSNGALRIGYSRGDTLTQVSGAGDPDGLASDPVTGDLIVPNESCVTSSAPSYPGRYTATSAPLPNERTYVGLGSVDLDYTFIGNAGQLVARVWDVAPDGTTRLVTRGVRRIDPSFESSVGSLRVPLFGNHWRLAKGHRVRLDLLESEGPYLRPSNPANTLTFSPPRLVLPTREASGGTLTGG